MTRRLRKVFFVACEGESEQGYAKLLKRFANNSGRHIQIDTKLMKTSNPKKLVQLACRAIGRRKQRDSLAGKFLMLDTDQMIGGKPDFDHEIHKEAKSVGLILIWQDKCFESVLLRHFEGHENDSPATSKEALKKLQKVWPQYSKGMSGKDLEQRITLADVQRAAKSPLNEDLRILLKTLDLLKNSK